MTMRFLLNRAAAGRVPYPAACGAVLDRDGFDAAHAAIAAWPGYAPTPLLALPGLARALGVASIHYKHEAPRFGLGSFKALGGAYAVERLVKGRDPATVTVTCATDGNHGRAVAWGAQRAGCRAVIFVTAAVSAGRAAAIEALGAAVRRVDGTYDDAVRAADAEAKAQGWIVVSDTAYPGYTEIPRLVMQGYGVMANEAFAGLEAPPTHLFLQAGVGALASAVIARAWQRWGADRPHVTIVEPETAACCFASLDAGRPVTVGGDLATVMAGLSCGEVSLLAWEILKPGAAAAMTIEDAAAVDALRLLAEGRHGDAPIRAGETGVAGLAGLIAAAGDASARHALGLDTAARVLLFGSEGVTDPAVWARLAGQAA